MNRQPVRIHPNVTPVEGRIVTFRDGPRPVPEYLGTFVTADAYPDLTFQEWASKVTNKEMEGRAVGHALGMMRLAHFGR